MNKRALFLYGMLGIFLVLSACKSEFERVRASNDPERMLQKAYDYYDEGEFYKAQILFELTINNYRGQAEAEKLYFTYAYSLYHQEQFILSAHYFNNFANTFINSELREEADFMSSYSYYRLSPSFRLDQSYTHKAIDGFQLFVNTYPESERVQECNELIDQMRDKLEQKAFMQGKLYYDMTLYEAAMHSFETVLKDFPETDRAEEIRFFVIESAYLYAKNSIYDKRGERYRVVLEKIARFRDKYPKSGYSDEVEEYAKESTEHLNGLTDVRY